MMKRKGEGEFGAFVFFGFCGFCGFVLLILVLLYMFVLPIYNVWHQHVPTEANLPMFAESGRMKGK